MSFFTGEVDLGSYSLSQLGGAKYPKPYYDYGGRVLFYDGFEDSVLRWTQNDDQRSATPPGITHITNRISHSGTSCLCIHMPRGNTNFQDANLGLQVQPLGAFPVIGLEAQVFILADSCRLGFSIERYNASSNSKYEWRGEKKKSRGQPGPGGENHGTGGGRRGEKLARRRHIPPPHA